VRLAVFFLGMAPGIDLAGVDMLSDLRDTLRSRGIELRLAEARGQVREALRRGGFEKDYGPIIANQPVATVIDAWRRDQSAPRPHLQVA
jgi:hypothetical protein